MSFVLSNSRKQLITMMKADLNYRLMIISARMQRTAAETQKYTQEKTTIQNAEIARLQEQGVENVSLSDVQNISNLTADIDVQLSMLAMKDDDMECEMRLIETQLQALNEEETEINKLVDNSIKQEFKIFSN